jgi:hypothetical protein
MKVFIFNIYLSVVKKKHKNKIFYGFLSGNIIVCEIGIFSNPLQLCFASQGVHNNDPTVSLHGAKPPPMSIIMSLKTLSLDLI